MGCNSHVRVWESGARPSLQEHGRGAECSSPRFDLVLDVGWPAGTVARCVCVLPGVGLFLIICMWFNYFLLGLVECR